MRQSFKMLGRAALLAAIGGVWAGAANAETVAWWRFEDGAAGTTVTGTQNLTTYTLGVTDFSGNGNHLVARNSSDRAVLYVGEVPPVSGPNTLSIRNRADGTGGLMTWSAGSNPSLDIEKAEFEQFTIEAFFKPTASDVSAWNTIVGWDGGDPARIWDLAEEIEPFKFYRIEITDVRNGGNNLAHISEFYLLADDGTRVTDAPGTPTASSGSVGATWDERAPFAFDRNPGSMWTTASNLNTQSPAWLQFELAEPASISAYGIQIRGSETGRDPKAWTLKGSNDGVTWTDIDVQSNITSYPSREDATVYFQLVGESPVGRLRINYLDRSGTRHILTSPNALVPDKWYYGAAVMDGSELRLYLANLTDGETEPQLVGSLNVSGSASTKLIPRPDVLASVPTPRASWSVARGWWGSNEGDHFQGLIDEVRISNHAVSVSDMLIAVGVPVELDTFMVE